MIFKSDKGVKNIYQALINSEDIPSGIIKWKNNELNIDDWSILFKILHNVTKDPKLIWLQYRILHNILTTNRSASKFKPEQSHLCSFCNEHSEYISHLLFECKVTTDFWKRFFDMFNLRCKSLNKLKPTKDLIIFNYDKNQAVDNVFANMILMGKMFVYRCKVLNKQLSVPNFMFELYKRYEVEKVLAGTYKENNEILPNNEWALYSNLFKGILRTET